MTKGSLGFIRVLISASVMFAVLIAGFIIMFGFNEEGEVASVFWDSIATVINGWMPSFEDGSPGYLFLMSVIAIIGVLFTSVLIGIVTSAIEEKIYELKRGNSIVLEKDHILHSLGVHIRIFCRHAVKIRIQFRQLIIEISVKIIIIYLNILHL